MAYDIEGARKAGLSNAEINDYLSKKHNYNLDGARKAGVNEDEITSHLFNKESAKAKPAEEKPKPKEESSFGDKALDYIKSGVLGPAVNTIAGLPRALESGVRNLPRMGLEALQTNNMSGPGFTGALAKTALQAGENLIQGKPAGVSENFVGNVVGTKEQRQKDLDQKIALDRAISSVPHIPGTEELAEYGVRTQNELNEAVTPEAKQAMEGSQPSGSLVEAIKTGSTKNLSFGKDPSLYGYSLNATQALGSMLPAIATAILTKKLAPGAQTAATSTVGYGQAAGEGIQSAKEYVANMDDATLAQSSPYYKKMIEDGVSPEEARKAVSDHAAEYAGQLQGAMGAFGSEITGRLITGGFDKIIDKYAKTRLAKIALGTAASTTEESTGEFLEGIASDIGVNKAVVKEIGEDSFANFVLGALGGAPVGAIAGASAKSEDSQTQGTNQTTPPPPPGGQQTQTTSSAFTDDELNESENVTNTSTTPAITGITSQDNDIDQILEGAEIVGANGTSTGASFKIVKPRRGKSAKGAGATNTAGVDGAGAAISSTDAGAQGEQSPLNEIEQNLIAKMQESGSDFKDVNHVKNWVKKHIFKGDLDGTNQLQQNNPEIFKRLLGEHKNQVTKNQEQKDQQDEEHLNDLENTINVIEEKKKKDSKNTKLDDAAELVDDALDTPDPVMKRVKTKKAKEKVEGAKPAEIPGFEYYEETDANGTITSGYRRKEELTEDEKNEEKEISSNPEAQEVLSKIHNDPNVPEFKKTLAQKFLHPYLLSKSEYGLHAPKNLDEAIKTAAAEDAADELSLINLTKRDKALEDEAKANNEAFKKEFDAKVQKLVEERGISVEKARREIGGAKKQTQTKTHVINSRIKKSIADFHEFSKSFVNTDNQKTQQEPVKKAEIDLRKDFIASLTKQQKAEFDKLRKQFIHEDHKLRANRTRAENTKERTVPVNSKSKNISKLSEEIQAAAADVVTTKAWNRRLARTKALLKKQRTNKKALAEYEQQLEDVKNEPIEAQNRLAAALEEAIKAGKNIVEVLKTIAGKDYTKNDTTAMLISAHYAKLIKQIKGDVKIVYGAVENGRPAKFDPATNTITISETYNGQETLDEIINHEVTHYLLDHLVDNPKLLSAEQKKALNQLRNQYKRIKTELNNRGQKFDIPNLKEFVAEIMSNKEFQKAVAKLPFKETSVSAIAGASSIVKSLETGEEAQTKREARPTYLTDLARSIAKLLGFNRFMTAKDLVDTPYEERNMGYSLQDVIGTIQQMISPEYGYVAPSEEFRGKKVSYAPSSKPRRKTPSRPRNPDEIAIEEAERVQSDLQEGVAFVKGAIALVLDPRNTYRFLVKHLQNSAAPLKLWQKNMDLKGQTKRDLDEVDANGKPVYNHVYELLQTMFAKADSKFYEECGDLSNELTKQLKEIQDLFKFSVIPNKKGLTKFAKTLGKLDSYLKAMHEPERRRILFLKNLKLRDDIQIQLPNGFVGTPANIKARIFESLDRRGLSEAQAKNLRNLLDSLVFANKGDLNATLAKDRVGTLNMNLVDQAYYIGQNKQYLLDENNQEYSPVNEIQPVEVDMIRGQLENDPVIGPKVKEIFKTLQAIEAKSKVMYKEGNYWSPQVSNYINFYGFEHYVPYKGRPDLAMSKNDSLFYSKDDPLSKRFHEATKGMGGRASSGNNSIIQILMDAKKSSFSIYSNQVSVAMGNAIESGKIPTTTKDKKPYKSIKFENRETELTDEEIAKRNTIFVYRPDGVLDIYTIKDRPILESLRAPYKANQRSNWFMEGWASLTRMLGLNYTLFNLKFAAWNLARDVMTNLFTLPIYHGYRAGAEYIYNVVKTATIDTVAGGGMFKAGKAMHLYQTKQMGKLKQLAQSGDKFYQNFYDAEKSGGVVTFLQGVSSRGEIIDLSKKVGQGNIIAAGKLGVAVFQYWFNMFELTSKMSAWEPIKGALRRKFPNLPEKAIIEKAAYEMKSLANFEQSGTFGKELGTFYMFARAQATGAVTWIDAFSHVLPVEVAMTDLSKEDKADPQVVATYKENYSERAWRARVLVALAIGAGYAIYGMSHMAADDDELDDNKISKDDPALWTRAARFTLSGTDNKTVVQMPWGFGGGSLMALGSQISILNHGNQTLGQFWSNLGQIMGDSYLPIPMSRISMTEHPMEAIYDTASPSMLRAGTEWVMNMDGLGHAIRQDESRSKMAKAFTGRGNTPEYIKNICIMLNRDFDIDFSPNSVSFWMNSYFSAINQFATTVDNIRLVAEDEKQFDAKTDGIFVGSFLGKLPDHEAKEWVETSSAINKFIQMKNGKKVIGYDTDYLLKHPGLYDLIEKYNDDVNGRLKTLQEKANDIRNIQGSREYKDNELKYNNYEQRRLKKELIFMYKEMYPELKNEMDKKKDKENN